MRQLRYFAVAAALLLSACAGGSDTSSSSSSSSTAAASPAAVASASTVVQYDGATLPSGRELTALQSSCEICHSFDMVYKQRLSKAVWTAEVGKMMKWGSPLPKNQEAMVVAYLTKYLGPTVPRSGVLATATAPPEAVPGTP